MSQVIDIVSLYPKDMNIYGDSGNVLTIQRRLALYGYEPRVHAYNQGCDWPEHVDMILGGGGQDTGQKKIIDDFFLPYLDIRNRKAGYAVSIVKAGAKIAGYDAGPVRTPLTDLLPEEYEALAALIDKQGAQ